MRCVLTAAVAALLLGGCAASRPSPDLAAAEAFVDAFYSFDAARLREALAFAEESIPRIVFYQGWAEGGNYRIVERKPCELAGADEVRCSITVKDDLIAALGTGFDVTDTFHITFAGGKIVRVTNTSNDPPLFEEALHWIQQEKPEVLEGPCRGFFDGGPTPGECARTVVRAFAEFAARRR